MKVLSLALVLTALVGLAGCTTPGCLVQNKAADLGSNFIASVLGPCEHPELIKEDLNVILSKTGLCKKVEEGVPQGVLADTFCPVLAEGAVELLKRGIPAKYGCKADSAAAFSKEKLTALCKQLPFAPND